MAKRDYYEILGVPKDTTAANLKSAFRKKAMQYHPDRNPDDAEAEAKFKEVGEAYEVLKDGDKRALYDRHGHAAFDGSTGGRGGGAGFDAGFSSSMSDIFEDLFGDFMGGGGGRRGSRGRGSDIRHDYELTLEEAFLGKEAEIQVPTQVICGECSGTGAEADSQPVTCTTCKGHGKVRMAQGIFSIERTCPTCHGRGSMIEHPCKICAGSGRTTKTRILSVDIPAGVEDGIRIRVSGEGEAGLQGGPSGDLYLFLSIKPHDIFQRDGADLYCRVPISITTAALGGTFEVPTIDGGRASVKVPEGTQSGKQFRLRGKGMPILRKTITGDMYVQTMVETPQKLSKRQREILQEFETLTQPENNPDSEGFFGRVKDLFGR